MNTIVQFCYGANRNLHNGSKFWRKKLIWFQNFYYIKKAAIVSNFCLIGKIPHDFLVLTSIELARKTFIGIQVKISIEWAGSKQLIGRWFQNSNFCACFLYWDYCITYFFNDLVLKVTVFWDDMSSLKRQNKIYECNINFF